MESRTTSCMKICVEKPLLSYLCNVINGAEYLVPRHRGTNVQAYGAVELTADSEYLVNLATGRWVDWAIGWVRGITRFIVEVYKGIPSAELVPFDHMSGGPFKSANIITYGFLGKPYCKLSSP